MKRFRAVLIIFLLMLTSGIISGCNDLSVSFIVNFDTNGGTFVQSVTYKGDNMIAIPDDPTKEGYLFEGWYWDNDTFEKPFTVESLLIEPITSDLTVYAKWALQDSELTTTLKGIYQLAVQASAFTGTYEEWLETVRGPQGIPGIDGRTTQLRVNGTSLQWKYIDETVWIDLFDLGTLKGQDGKAAANIDLRVSDGYIQWQHEGDTSWTNLIDLLTITGATGANGLNGEDGREIIFQVADGYIQWKYEGDLVWVDLLDTATIIDIDLIEQQITELEQRISELEKEIDNLDIQSRLTETINQVSGSVVGIKVYIDEDFVGSGSGVIYKTFEGNYFVVTNYHVVDSGTTFKIYLEDHSEKEAYLIQYDYYSDLAVLKFLATEDYTVATIGESNSVNPGDFVLAIGSPLGNLNFNSSTFGIVSGINRLVYDDWDDYYGELYIQHDAPINPGNSGGGLFNLNGEFIGINTLKFVDESVEGMGFAIPSNAIKNVISYLEKGEPYPRAVYGYEKMINVNYIRNNPKEYPSITISSKILNGVYVINPSSQGIFGISGIIDKDIILSINGIAVNFWYEVEHQINYQNTVQDDIKFEIYRNGAVIEVIYNHTLYNLGYYTYETVEYENGTYVGELYNGKKHGYGEYYYLDGNFYFGDWQNDYRHGYGVFLWENGDMFWGNYKEGYRFGYGTYYWADGDRFYANWLNNSNTIEGIYYFASGTESYQNLVDGIWVYN